MRTFKTNLLGLALAGLILGACSQTATYETADLMNEQASAKNGGFNLSPFGMGGENTAVYTDEACVTECFKADDPSTWFYLNGRSNFNPQIYTDYKVYQSATEITYEFQIGASNSSNPTITSYSLNGTLTNVNATSFSVSFPLDANWKACDLVSRTFTINRGGQGGGATSVVIPIEYKLIPICLVVPDTCPEYFDWTRDVNDANTIIFEYTPHRSKIGAEIQITTPQITAFQAMDGKTYTQFGNMTNGNGGLRWNGDLVCGQKITFTIKFTPISCNNDNNLPANLASTFLVRDMGGNKLTGEPIEGACVIGS